MHSDTDNFTPMNAEILGIILAPFIELTARGIDRAIVDRIETEVWKTLLHIAQSSPDDDDDSSDTSAQLRQTIQTHSQYIAQQLATAAAQESVLFTPHRIVSRLSVGDDFLHVSRMRRRSIDRRSSVDTTQRLKRNQYD